MDIFDENNGLYPIGMDPELQSALDACKTEEERKKVLEDYVFMRLKAMVIALLIVIGMAFIVGVISWLLGGSLGVAGFPATFCLKFL